MATDTIRAETVECIRRLWAVDEIQNTFWRLSWSHPQDTDIPLQSELAFVLSNAKPIYTQPRVCTSTLALRFVHELFAPGQTGALVQLKPYAVVAPRGHSAPLPSGSNARAASLVFSIDMCTFKSAQRTLASEVEAFRNALTARLQQVARANVVLLFANLVQFAIDIERYQHVYRGVPEYNGPPSCATSVMIVDYFIVNVFVLFFLLLWFLSFVMVFVFCYGFCVFFV